MKRKNIRIAVLGAVALILFNVIAHKIIDAFGLSDKSYSKSELAAAYASKSSEIIALSQYFQSICPKGKTIEIEFDGAEKVSRFKVSNLNGGFGGDNLAVDDAVPDSVLATMHWNRNTLKSIWQKLDAANCISISNAKPAQIGFKRSGMGMYTFLALEKPMNDNLRKFYESRCEFLIYNEKMVFQHGGGAIDSDCFPEARK